MVVVFREQDGGDGLDPEPAQEPAELSPVPASTYDMEQEEAAAKKFEEQYKGVVPDPVRSDGWFKAAPKSSHCRSNRAQKASKPAATVDDKWYYVDDKELEQGPFSSQQMKTWLKHLGPKRRVRREGETEYTLLDTVVWFETGEEANQADVRSEPKEDANAKEAEAITFTPTPAAVAVDPMLERAKKKFDQLDADGSGVLEGAELQALGEWVWSNFHPDGQPLSEAEKSEQGQKLLHRLDANTDGSMSFDEFGAWFNNTHAAIQRFRRARYAKSVSQGGKKTHNRRHRSPAKASPSAAPTAGAEAKEYVCLISSPGVAYRNTPNFKDKIPTDILHGPESPARVVGSELQPGWIKTELGWLPLASPDGKIKILEEVATTPAPSAAAPVPTPAPAPLAAPQPTFGVANTAPQHVQEPVVTSGASVGMKKSKWFR